MSRRLQDSLRKDRRGFTLVEMIVSLAIFSALGLIIFGVASEGLFAFSRNVSINRSYTEARRALDRIGFAVQTAGYKPLLLDATGAITATSPAAGIRVWRNGPLPCYNIITPQLTSTTLTLSLAQPSNPSSYQAAPAVGDIITVSALSFQAVVTGVVATATQATVSFSGTLVSKTKPAITTVATNYFGTTNPIQYSCLDWTPAAFIAVGTQLRYYPTFIPGTTGVSDTTQYRVVTNLVSSLAGGAAPLPFSLNTGPSITGQSVNVDIYAEAPDYNNRNLGTANTYTYLQSAFAPRNAAFLNSPP